MPGTSRSRSAAAASRSSSAVEIPSASPELDQAAAARGRESAEADELRAHACARAPRARRAPGLDELAQPRLDRAADPAQLAHSPAAHELGDRSGCRADQLRRAPVRANAVVARPGEVEQRRQRLELLGERCVFGPHHAGSVLDAWPTVVVPFRGADPKQRLAVVPIRARQALADAMLADVVAARVRGRRRSRRRAGGHDPAVEGDTRRRPAARAGRSRAGGARRRDGRRAPGALPRRERRPAVRDSRATCSRSPAPSPERASRLPGGRRDDERARASPTPSLFEPVYGPGSAARFAALARRRSLDAPNLIDDVDTLDDLARLGRPARPAHPRACSPRSHLPCRSVKVTVLSGGVGGARFLRGLVGCRRSRQRFHRRQRGRRHRGARTACLARPRQHPLRARGRSPTRSAAGVAPTRPGTRSRPSAELGGEEWFRLGDRDLGLHLVRTRAPARRRAAVRGDRADRRRPSASTRTLLPATDDPLRTFLETPAGTFPFQTWFVARGHRDEVDAVHYAGAPEAAPAPGVVAALERRRRDR